MPKKYTAAEWARIQSKLPEEDREPYSSSPDIPVTDSITEVPGVVDPAKQTIAKSTLTLAGSIDSILGQSEKYLSSLLNELEGDESMADADAFAAAAQKAAEEAENQMAEGDKLFAEGEEAFTRGFYSDTTTDFGDLTASQQKTVNKGLFGSSAGLTALYSALSAIGVEGLVDVIAKIREAYPDISSEDAMLLLKYDKRYNEPYLNRFSGNKVRMANGLAPLDDQTYLANEAAYQKIFKAYGLNQFENREQYAKFIGNDVAPDEVAGRVSLVYDRVNNSIPQVKEALLKFYPELTTQDLMAYVLDPTTQLPAIQRKVQAAEIGAAALAQNLGTSLQATTFAGDKAAPYTNVSRGTIGVEAMLQAGTDAAEAAKASAYVADVMGRGEFLSSIYADGYQQYGQLEAEKEAYLGSIEAKKAREAIVSREKAEFAGEEGRLKSQSRAVGGRI